MVKRSEWGEESDMEETFILRREPLLAQQQETPYSLINHLYIGHFLARWGAKFFFHISLITIDLII